MSVVISLLFTFLFLVAGTTFAAGILHRKARIALAGQGRGREMLEWLNMMNIMDTKDQITLFMLSFDVPINSTVCDPTTENTNVVCLHAPGSSWTVGRNMLARAIAKNENKNKHFFKYWIFGDADMVKLEHCDVSTKCTGSAYPQLSSELAACCFDTAVEVLSAPEVQYAEINFFQWAYHSPNYIGFSHLDCGDAALAAFHRAAVPVVLPYIDLLDKKSWWESQGIHFHVAASCYPGYSVYSNVFSMMGTYGHSAYPRGRFPVFAEKALRQVYGKVNLIPNPITLGVVQLEQGNCANLSYNTLGLSDKGYEPNRHLSGATKIVTQSKQEEQSQITPNTQQWNSAAWQNSTAFKQCLSSLKPRFMRFVATGNLTEIDGQMYSAK